MPKPDSLVTWWRRWAAKRLMPGPDPGEAWCFGCALNGGQTIVVSASGYSIHVGQHRELTQDGGDHYLEIQVSWPV